MKPTEDATFVALTVCPSFAAAYKDQQLKYKNSLNCDTSNFKTLCISFRKHGLTRAGYQYGDYRTTDQDYRAVFEEVVFDLPEILESITLTTSKEGRDKVEVDLEEDNNKHGRYVCTI